jgi:hypothetical protein
MKTDIITNNKKSSLSKALSERLCRLTPSNNAELSDMQWQFSTDIDRYVTLDFQLFEKKHIRLNFDVSIEYCDECMKLQSVELAKLLWISLTSRLKPGSQQYRGAFTGLLLLFSFLNRKNISRLTKLELEEYFSYCLNNDVTETRITRRLTPPSFGNRLECFSFAKLREILELYRITELLDYFSEETAKRQLNKVCIEQLNLTAAEYRQGGSFNLLGLDVGKYYLDHCSNIFEENLIFTSTLSNTLLKCSSAKTIKRFKLSERKRSSYLGLILNGETTDIDTEEFSLFENFVHAEFRKKYKEIHLKTKVFQLDYINTLVEKLKLPEQYDTQEFIRVLLYIEIHGDTHFSSENIWSEYLASLEENRLIELPTLGGLMDSVKQLTFADMHLPTSTFKLRQFIKSEVDRMSELCRSSGLNGLRKTLNLIDKISYAGTTCFVGATGWRASEFSFPLSAVTISRNDDPIDNYYTPLRFHVVWPVKKQSGETKLTREITLGSYLIALQVNNLRGVSPRNPIFPSIELSVKDGWRHFVQNYRLFTDLNQQSQLTSPQYRELRIIKEKVTRELKIVSSALDRYGNNYIGEMLKRYQNNTISKDERLLLSENISVDTLEKVSSGLFDLDKNAIMSIRAEALEGKSYPTPHSFRHIWAEAVYQRYRGDVGKFLRSHFKHMDGRFIAAYLREKAMKGIMKLVERHFINNCVREHIESLDDKYREYAGQTDRFLGKVMHATKIVSHDEYKELARKIGDERIISAQSNPWATCFLRIGTNSRAKCSIDGYPQPQNSSPKLCLDCINADITEGNFNGIVVYIKPDIDACRSPDLPAFIKDYHIKVVNSALKAVRKLNLKSKKDKYIKFIHFLEDTLAVAHLPGKIS